jgi:putative DNA primase/helicase
VFKQVTGGDPIYAERKYGHPFQFTTFATPWFSANEAPISSDQTEAWFRRWVILPLERTFSGTDADPFLLQKLTSREELEGLLVVAVSGLRRLLTRGAFELPPSVKAAGEKYRDRLDTVRSYVAEACLIDPDLWVRKADLYSAYKEWCREGERHPLSRVTFNERIQRGWPDVYTVERRGYQCWNGLGQRSWTP